MTQRREEQIRFSVLGLLIVVALLAWFFAIVGQLWYAESLQRKWNEEDAVHNYYQQYPEESPDFKRHYRNE
jgi:hypothetical protein